MDTHSPIYNSRLINVYIKLIAKRYPKIDTNQILNYAGMTTYEVSDPAHWFSQDQVDRFSNCLLEKIKNPDIFREAGRFAASSNAMGAIRQYILGLISITKAYLMMEKLYPMVSRGATVTTKIISTGKVEIISKPGSGVEERSYQCSNRMGIFEAVAKLFTGKYANIEHSECIHNGNKVCRYVISWENTPALLLRRIRNYSIILGTIVSLIFFLFASTSTLTISFSLFVIISVLLTLLAFHHENKDLKKSIETQGNAAKELLDQMDIRYNIALLNQEIGHAASSILDMDDFLRGTMNILKNRMDFDRGMIMLPCDEKILLKYKTGFGYDDKTSTLFKGNVFHLDHLESEGPFVRTFLDQKPILVNDVNVIKNSLSENSRVVADRTGSSSFITVPLVYKNESLGILAVDNIKSKRPLTQSDVSLLSGVASQIAVSITNTRARAQLQKSEKKYRELVENANSIILRMDTKGCIIFFNEFAQNFFSYSEEEIIGANAMDNLFKDSDSAKQSFEALINSLEKDYQQQYARETKILLGNGEYAWVTWTFKPIVGEDGQMVEVLCIGNDITELRLSGEEKKGLETQLLRAQKMEAIGTLAGGVAHDFNNILQAISGCAQILMFRKKEDDPDYNKLATIEKSVKTARDLTQRLLISSRKVEIELKPIDLNQEIVSISKMLERMIPKMIKIELHLDANLKFINADMTQIEQIIMNLGVNARDAMPDGGELVFKTENRFLDEEFCKRNIGANPGNYALLTVSDSGHGMDEEVLEHIYEPFFTTKETGKGTGLGMAMVYGIVKSHGGYISVETEIDKGTTFMIYFPALKKEFEEEFDGNQNIIPVGGDETLLLVDDDDTIRRVGEEILSNYGYKVFVAEDGERALDFYGKDYQNIDLVLLDLIMPGMGGKKCLENLVKINPDVKVIVVSGFSIDGYTREVVQSLSKGFIKKPYEASNMLQVVRKAIDT